ncbi:ABC transporter ATP-binding protein [Bradyrhizobium prioriisuperbiae]|uniref:ABC transporter ATP-binding protein n=1 Tax=Bradyrhizobium prioriisuperbiae TaxID=2854389 RepID=UPI0028E94925|nr:ATP-binding cassette domain-containing protein [Bradyrhizobium prioritasuperba]
MISLARVRKIFGPGTPDRRVALNDVSFNFTSGEFVIVIGGNGAGKSTLLNAIAGSIRLDSGSIRFDDADITGDSEERRARHIARVFQDPMLGTAAHLTVEENLTLAALRDRKPGWRAAISSARSRLFRDRLALLQLGLEDRLQSRVGLLSGGQRQALALTMATLNEPRLLLLDEHTAALDPHTSELVMRATIDAITTFGLTALMVTHNMRHAIDTGTRLLMMDKGELRADIDASEKKRLTIPDLIARFSLSDDKMLLSA